MVNKIYSPTKQNVLAEGQDRTDLLEPNIHLDTRTFPALSLSNPRAALTETGTTETILPRAEGRDQTDLQDAARPKDETQVAPDNGAEAQAEKPGILIVEDTVELAEVIQATLQGMGYEAAYATHGATGLEILRDMLPELVILDIGLPDITGWKMLDGIKAHYNELESDMPVIIVITAYGDPANRLIGKLQDIHSYLIKPFTPDQVERLVNMALRGEKPGSDDPASAK